MNLPNLGTDCSPNLTLVELCAEGNTDLGELITAAIDKLAALKRRCAVELYTDSQTVLSAVDWFPCWDSSRKQLEYVRHKFKWEDFYAVASKHDIQWHAVKGANRTAEFVGRTPGVGRDVGFLYGSAPGAEESTEVPPWHASLGDYRPFTDEEMQLQSVCYRVDAGNEHEARPPSVQLLNREFTDNQMKSVRMKHIARAASVKISPHMLPDGNRSRPGAL